MDSTEVDANLERIEEYVGRNIEGGYPYTFADVAIVHLWRRIQDLEAEVSILMTAHMNPDAGGSEP